RTDSACPWSSGVSASSPRYPSTRPRSSSGARTGLRLLSRLADLELDLLQELGQLLEDLVRRLRLLGGLQLRAQLLGACEQLLHARQALAVAHAARSRAIRPRIPFTSRPASSVAYLFASVTASSIATSAGTASDSISWIAI